jgi:hypothetical protein
MNSSSERTLVDRVVSVVDYQTVGTGAPDAVEIHTIKQILVGYCRHPPEDVEASIEEAVAGGQLVQEGERYRLPEYHGEGCESVR